MLSSLSRSHALSRVPREAALKEIKEKRIFRVDSTIQRSSSMRVDAAFAIRHCARSHVRIEEHRVALRGLQERFARQAEDFHLIHQLLALVVSRKERMTRVQLGKNAAKAPHVDRSAILAAKNHFRRTIEAALDIGVDLLMVEAARAKVNNLDVVAILRD
jgi:hypothetical protein